MIAAAPHVLVDYMLDAWSEVPDVFPESVRAAYRAAFTDPATIHAICEEYRAAATLDVADDEADRGHRRIECPTLVLWSATRPGRAVVQPARRLEGLGHRPARPLDRRWPFPA